MHYYIVCRSQWKMNYFVIKIEVSFTGATPPHSFLIPYTNPVVFAFVCFIEILYPFSGQLAGNFFILSVIILAVPCRFLAFALFEKCQFLQKPFGLLFHKPFRHFFPNKKGHTHHHCSVVTNRKAHVARLFAFLQRIDQRFVSNSYLFLHY